jgi:hypothetical protein
MALVTDSAVQSFCSKSTSIIALRLRLVVEIINYEGGDNLGAQSALCEMTSITPFQSSSISDVARLDWSVLTDEKDKNAVFPLRNLNISNVVVFMKAIDLFLNLFDTIGTEAKLQNLGMHCTRFPTTVCNFFGLD